MKPAYLALLLAPLMACDLTGGETKKTAPKADPATTQAASQTAATAFENLFQREGKNVDQSRSELASSQAKFQAILATDPSNSTASAGLAATKLSLRFMDMQNTMEGMYDRGLVVGGTRSNDILDVNVARGPSGLAPLGRAMMRTESAPALHELQDSLQTMLLPALDSARLLLEKSWNDPAFRLKVAVPSLDDRDSLEIDHADIGMALAAVRFVAANVRWVCAYDIDVDHNGSYAWIDTMDNVVDTLGPQTPAQQEAVTQLQSLLAPGSQFLKLRPNRAVVVDALPAEFIAILDLVRSAAVSARDEVTTDPDQSDDLVQIDASIYNQLAEVLDSAKLFLQGPRLLRRPAITTEEYVGWNDVTNQPIFKTYHTPEVTMHIDIRKLITMRDWKVFLPKYQWNANTAWAKEGPVTMTGSKGSVTALDFDPESNGWNSYAGYLEWNDPTFGGVFPDFANSEAVVHKLNELSADPSEEMGLSFGAARLLL